MKLRGLLALSVLALANVGTSFAVASTNAVHSISLGSLLTYDYSLSQSNSPGYSYAFTGVTFSSFTDTFAFTTNSPAEIRVVWYMGTSNLTASIAGGPAFTSGTQGVGEIPYSGSWIGQVANAGTYQLTISGNLTPSPSQFSGGYSLTFTGAAAAPVPEPETYAMLLAGLGLIGMVSRRRGARVCTA